MEMGVKAVSYTHLPIRNAIGARGRAWVLGHFNGPTVAELTLNLYAEVARPPIA